MNQVSALTQQLPVFKGLIIILIHASTMSHFAVKMRFSNVWMNNSQLTGLIQSNSSLFVKDTNISDDNKI